MHVDGEKIRQLRLSKGWSQRDLAEAAGVGQKVIWNMENGVGEHRPATVSRVAEALDTSVKALLASEPPAAETVHNVPDALDAGPIETWKQIIYNGEPGNGGTIESTDEVLLERLGGEEIRAKIRRIDPPTGGEWEFLGRREVGMIYGHYWRTKGEGSYGVLLLRETGPHAKLHRGFYTKIRRDMVSSGVDTLSISHITLDWVFEGEAG